MEPAGLATAVEPGASSWVVNIAAKHGWPSTAAILISVGLHGSVYALLSAIERPAPPVQQSEPVMAYIVPASVLIPEPPPAPPEPSKEEVLLTEIRDALRAK